MKPYLTIGAVVLSSLLGSSTGYADLRPEDERTERSLMNTAGIYAGTVKVFTDGEGHFLAEGRYSPTAHPQELERALKEADVDGNGIATLKEAEELSRKVIWQYAQNIGKEGYQSKVCASDKEIGSKDCKFTLKVELGRCESSFRKANFDLMDRKRNEMHCEGEAFKNSTNPQPCLDKVAQEYAKKEQDAKAAYATNQAKARQHFTTCTHEVETEYQQCLKSDTLPEPKKSRSGERYLYQEKDEEGYHEQGRDGLDVWETSTGEF